MYINNRKEIFTKLKNSKNHKKNILKGGYTVCMNCWPPPKPEAAGCPMGTKPAGPWTKSWG
jgi:hypothetical protein